MQLFGTLFHLSIFLFIHSSVCVVISLFIFMSGYVPNKSLYIKNENVIMKQGFNIYINIEYYEELFVDSWILL